MIPGDDGPGTELKVMFKVLGIERKGCHCNSMISQMNRLGTANCRLPENRAEIIAHLDAGAANYGWWDKVKAAAIAVSHGWTFALTWDGLIEEACRRAEQKSSNLGERVG